MDSMGEQNLTDGSLLLCARCGAKLKPGNGTSNWLPLKVTSSGNCAT
jgi:hypothetical protein